jgi:hypothetical protein
LKDNRRRDASHHPKSGAVPVFRSARVPVQTLFDYLEGGNTLEVFALEALEEAKPLRLDECTASGHGFCFPATAAKRSAR